jgi:CRP-like cAMP-binding protein
VDYSFIIGEEEFHEGERITKEGGHGKWIWVILEGAVEVSRQTPEGPLVVARLGEGCFIGTFEALMYRENPRTANVNTVTSLRLGLLDTERLSKVYTSFSPDLRTVLTGLDRRLRKVTDRAADLFLGKDNLKALIKDKGVVMEKGADREDLFTILEGEALVMGLSKKGVVPLLALGKEDIFGLVPFLDMGHEPREAAVVGSKDLKTRSLDVGTLQKEYNQIPAAFKNLVYHLGASIFTTTRLIYGFHETGRSSVVSRG